MTDKHLQISVIVTTYNRPDALRAVLVGLNAQKYKNFEVIIADDGSDKNTQEIINKTKIEIDFPIKHIWQANKGFRAAKARNKAVAGAEGEYLVFLDGDCVPLPDFIKKHNCIAEPGWFVRGNRMMLSELFTQLILKNDIDPSRYNFFTLFPHYVSGRIKRIFSFLYLPLGPIRKLMSKQWKGAKTCNLGIWKKDFIAVNGLDERYVGWGHEDADLVVRLIKSGIYRKEGNFYVPALHLWHKHYDRSNINENEKLLEHVINQDRIWIDAGVNQYL